LSEKFTSNDGDLRVATNIASLINGVATDAGKDAAVARLVSVARDIAGPGSTARLHATAEQMLSRNRQGNAPIPPEQLTRATELLRKTYLDLLVESIRTLARPAGTQYLISLAADPTTPIERRKSVLAAVANQVSSNDAPALLSIANGTGPQ